MNRLSKPANRPIIPDAHRVRSRFGEKVRLMVGLGINLVGAALLLAQSVRLLSI
jgi:hypothetical protein